MHRHQRRSASRPAWMENTNGHVEIRLLGGFEVVVNGTVTAARDWTRRPAAALVKVLAMVPGHRLHREQLMDILWPDDSPREAAPKLHKAAHFARKASGRHDAIVLLNDTVHLFPGVDLTVDVARFEELARLAIVEHDAVAADAAVSHYGGELLPEDRYEDWAAERRELLGHRYRELLRLAGRWVELAELDPTDEEAHLQVMQHFAGAGNCTAALRQFEHMERILDRDIGVSPGPEALELRDRIAAGCEQDDRATGAGRLSWVRTSPDWFPGGASVAQLLAELAELTKRQAALLDDLAVAGMLPAGAGGHGAAA